MAAVVVGGEVDAVAPGGAVALEEVLDALLGTPLVLLGLPGGYASRAAGYGRIGLLGTALLIVGVLAWTDGNLLLGVPLLRGNVRPAWPGYLLVGGAVMEIGQFAVGNSNVVASLVSALSGLLPFLALGGLGFRLWASRSPTATTTMSSSGATR